MKQMNIAGMRVYFASDLKDYGRTEDGTPFIGEVFFLEVENSRGDRWRLNRQFDGVRTEQGEEGVAYIDIRTLARVQCYWMRERIKAAGEINLYYWHQGRAAYGSDAYIEYGSIEELAWERAGEFR